MHSSVFLQLEPIAVLRCYTNAHNGKLTPCITVSDLKLATISQTKTLFLSRIPHQIVCRRRVPPSSRLWHSDQNLLEKCSHLHTCTSSTFDGIATMGLTCCVSAGAMLPANGLLAACSLEDSQDVSLFAQSMALMSVEVSLSPTSKHCNGTTVHVFLLAEALSLIVALCFLGQFVLCILGLVFALDVLCLCLCCISPCPCSSDSLRAALASVVDALLCSRDLENLLSHLIPACDPDAVPVEVLFHLHVLHPQHRHSCFDVVVYGLRGLVLVVVHGSLERRQLGWNVVSESVHQHVHRESHTPRPKLGLPLHHELPPSHEPLVHAGIVTLVQRGSCGCHHQNVVHPVCCVRFLRCRGLR